MRAGISSFPCPFRFPRHPTSVDLPHGYFGMKAETPTPAAQNCVREKEESAEEFEKRILLLYCDDDCVRRKEGFFTVRKTFFGHRPNDEEH